MDATTQYLSNLCFWLCSLGTFFVWFSFPSTNFYWQDMFDKRALLFMTTAYSVPAIFVQSAQAYFDKAVNDRFGKVKAYFFRITLCLAINVGIAASAPYWKPELGLFLSLITLLGISSSAAYGAFFQLVTLYPRTTTSFLSFGYSSPGIILPAIAIGIFGVQHEITTEHVRTFFAITASVCFLGLLSFYVLLWKSRDMLDAGDKKAHDRKVLAAKIRDLKAKRESEFSRGTASVGGSTSETASNINIQIESNPTKAIKWADLEQAAREEREEKRRRKAAQKAEAELEQEGLLQKQNYISEPPGRSASLNSASAYEIPATLQESSSDSSEKKDEEQVQLDDDDYDGYVGPEKEDEDTTPVLIAADVPITFDTSKFTRLSMSAGGNSEILRKIWPCGLALLVCNLSRLLAMNSLPEVPCSETLHPQVSLTQTLIFITLGCDLAGRLLTLIPLPREWWGMPSLLLGVAVVQMLSLNLFFIYVFQAPHDPMVPYSNIGAMIYTGIFSTTTGFLITQCYLVAPVAVKSMALKPQVGALMNVFSQVGNVLALVVGFVFAYTVFAPKGPE